MLNYVSKSVVAPECLCCFFHKDKLFTETVTSQHIKKHFMENNLSPRRKLLKQVLMKNEGLAPALQCMAPPTLVDRFFENKKQREKNRNEEKLPVIKSLERCPEILLRKNNKPKKRSEFPDKEQHGKKDVLLSFEQVKSYHTHKKNVRLLEEFQFNFLKDSVAFRSKDDTKNNFTSTISSSCSSW